MFKYLLLLILLGACSSIKKESHSQVEKKSISTKEQEKLEEFKSKIKFSKSLSELVGCSKLGELTINKSNEKKLEYYVYLEVEKMGGDTLSEVTQFQKRENPKGETIFTQGQNRFFFKSDVYRCK